MPNLPKPREECSLHWGDQELGDRLGEHLDALRKLDTSYAKVQHFQEFHLETPEPEFTFKVKATHRRSLERQLREALGIAHHRVDTLHNTK